MSTRSLVPHALRTLAAALLGLLAAPAAAAGFVFGGGVASLDVSSDALLEEGARSGFHVFAGWRLAEHASVAFEVTAAGAHVPTRETTEISYPEDRAELSVVDVRLRLDLLPLSRHRATPWVEAGLGIATLVWDTYFYSQQAVAPSFAAGVDVRIAGGLFLRGALSRVSARTTDLYDHETPRLGVTSLQLVAGWQFGWPPLRRGRARPPDESPPASEPAGAPSQPAPAPESEPEAPPWSPGDA